ncbi:protein SIEVE ELEMENT OCCLUSION B [Jatropha curcas]|uniref:protein SIEVE ELEMENT OCCLUSION B n=1 Tax=Jatropha curcas TaxID=180498 RepID=UPI001893C6FD|nr:protein SIEVE ELEMENT OCCLUSION B [Jatropha curcas]
MVAAFAVKYGEFYLLTELYTKNPVSKNIALLKQLQGVVEDAELLEQFSGAIIDLNKAMVALIRTVLQFNTLPSEYHTSNKPPFSTVITDIVRAVYWTIYSVVTCVSHFVALIGSKNQRTIAATMTWELSELATKVSSIQTILQKHFSRIKQEIDGYNVLVNLFETVQDITAIFQAFFHVEGGKLPLVVGSTKAEVKIEVLKDTKVLLLISGLDIWQVEIKALAKLYEHFKAMHNIQYQLVWIPVVEGNLDEQKLLSLQSLMPWFTVRHPSLIKPEVIRYIKEVWKFSKHAILVPFDQKGHAESVHTLDLVWVKGHLPGLLPSSPGTEISPWEEKQLTLDILIHDIYHVDSTKPAPIICLYGGEDMKWIEEFIAAITRVKEFTKLNIELVYVTKSNAVDEANKAIFDFITAKKIGVHWKAEETYSWRFWTRIESIFSSGLKNGKIAKQDNIMKDVMTLLSFNGSYKGWTIFGQLGSHQKIAKATGEVILQILLKINTWWKPGTSIDSFLTAINHQIEQQNSVQAHHCNHIVLPATIPEIPDELMTCAICDRKMSKYLMYRCCI